MSYKNAVNDILFSENDFKKIRNGIYYMYREYSKITNIVAEDLTNNKAIQTPYGIAASQEVAAHCLKDIARTTQFLRGIYGAIKDKLKENKNVKILYAGCGPYATLATPLTQVFNENKVSFTFLDINKSSLLAVQKIYEEWGISQFVDQYIEADATDPSLEMPQKFDIIISETMQMGLKNECQVPLTRNVIRFLKPNGVFIPEQVLIDIYLAGKENKYKLKESELLYLGSVYNLDFRNIPKPYSKAKLTVPDSEFKYLEMFTEIQVYKNHRLSAHDSSLTVPLILNKFVGKLPQSIEFEYQETEKPDFKVTYNFEKAVSV
tara:strand:- start:111466 stop:112425 length:960 start_codon:yes stop_codon:yes gene_type:complete